MSENINPVSRVIALEEHILTPDLRTALLRYDPDETVSVLINREPTIGRLLDTGEERLTRMDAAGVDVQVLSITAPGTQQLPKEIAVSVARDANDYLADAVQRHPDRFKGLATLPTPDPDAAAKELQRCVEDHKFVGAMLFPRSGDLQLDHNSFRPIFEAAAELKVPLYIHPGLPPKIVRDACYSGFSPMTNLILSTGGWGWHAEAGLTTLRLILAGTFDRHPDLQLILGHWGEMLVPFADRAEVLTRSAQLERRVTDYITGNLYVTAGGVFSHRMLRQNFDVVGADRILIGVDDPFSGSIGQEGKAPGAAQGQSGFVRRYIETAPLSDEEKAKLAHQNAERLMPSLAVQQPSS